jgi:phosphoribosylamine-glycine ligase
MAQAGTPYQGVLYVGLMICDGKPKVLSLIPGSAIGDPGDPAVIKPI